MCGIVAYIGTREAKPILIEGLKRLEYRGYDSAGLAVLNPTSHVLELAKAVGRVSKLENKLEDMIETGDEAFDGTIGLAHTRWATHGSVSEVNAHPHRDDKSGICLVHNGIIENYSAVRTYLQDRGHTFVSETDTEVLAMLIGELYDPKGGIDLEAAVQAALREVDGAYAIAVVCEHEPDAIVCARKGSPLIVGVGNGEYIIASDPSAIVAHTTQAITLDDYNVIKVTRDGFRTSTIDNLEVTPKIMQLEMELEQIELGSYSHYMLKEIYEQPASIANTLRGRIDLKENKVVLSGLNAFAKELVKSRRVIITGQGTALHAAMIGEYLFEDIAKIPTETEYASEFRYRNPIIEDGTVVIAVSQSGETADTLAALTEAKERGALALGVVNVVGSTISRETDSGVYLRVGPEIGVASTKAFTGQVTVLTLMALFLGRRRFTSPERVASIMRELNGIPQKIERILEQDDHIRKVTERYVERNNWLFLGRGYNYPTAMEGALKLKEISYIHAEGMPAVFIANRGSQYEKVLSNIHEVRSRGGHIIAVATEGDEHIKDHAEDVIYVPDVPEALSPLVTVVPLQLLAYHAAVMRGHDVDKPRNLAKSVTVE